MLIVLSTLIQLSLLFRVISSSLTLFFRYYILCNISWILYNQILGSKCFRHSQWRISLVAHVVATIKCKIWVSLLAHVIFLIHSLLYTPSLLVARRPP